MARILSWSRVLFDDALHFLLVRLTIFLKQIVGVCLCWRFRVRIIEQVLNAKENLLDCDRRFPAFFFVQDRKANRARRVDVGVKERWNEFALKRMVSNLDLFMSRGSYEGRYI